MHTRTKTAGVPSLLAWRSLLFSFSGLPSLNKMRAALRLLALCAVLVAAQAASSSAHGDSKGRGDGYNFPISKNSAWKFYRWETGDAFLARPSKAAGRHPSCSDAAAAAALYSSSIKNTGLP